MSDHEQEKEIQEQVPDIKEQVEKAKNQFIDDLKNMTDYEEAKTVLQDESELVNDPRILKFTVQDPQKASGFVSYIVSGEDQEGAFLINRRFKEFSALRLILSERWPGVYIPAIPEKKAFGNKDDEFVEERRSLLERFLQEIAKHNYLVNSQEFKIFARDNGDIEKVLGALPK